MAGIPVPEDLVMVGYVSGAYGLNGWIRIKPYSPEADALLQARTWWLDKPDFHDVEMLNAKFHSGDVVAHLMGVAGRETAEALKGASVKISRKYFPPLADDEYYWVDLIGLDVENLQGECLGRVADMMENGAHPILRVALPVLPDAAGEPAGKKGKAKSAEQQELLIPFVAQFVKTVDQKAKKITVDWGLDY
jgi:16S rRNA processing protein RimM